VLLVCLQEFEPAQYGIVDLSKLSTTSDSTPASTVSTSSDSQTATTLTTTSSSSSSSAGSASGRSSRVGYLKVLTFSATAPQAVAEALLDIQKEAQQAEGLAGLIVDLRDNPGGIVEAGVDIAQVRKPSRLIRPSKRAVGE
jgi:carboxyl-terminal processing protease